MKYFIDFEFLEGDVPVKIFGLNVPKWLIKPNNTIQPISVGICSSDGREYYAISKDFNLKEAWNKYDLKESSVKDLIGGGVYTQKEYWIRENVLKPIFYELINKDINFHNYDNLFTYKYFKELINKYGKTNKQIAEEIEEFCKEKNRNYYNLPKGQGYRTIGEKGEEVYQNTKFCSKPEFYGYYSAYDHVVLCWLFGKMIDLPNGFPMYTIDLKQEMDRIQKFHIDRYKMGNLKSFAQYPKQTNEHSAIHDARWNKKLYTFLKDL